MEKNEDIEEMIYCLELKYDEIVVILEIEIVGAKTIGYTLPPGFYETGDLKLMLRLHFPVR